MANIQISLQKLNSEYKKECILSFLFIIGAVFGGSHYLCWNDIVENSAFKAGLIDYSIKTPQYYFQSRLNSFFYVLVDLLFKTGLSELTLTLFTSALLGGLSFFTLGYIGVNILLSFWVIPAVIFTDYFLLYEFGVNYHIAIVNSKFPQGHFGLVSCVFLLVFHSINKNKFSAFLIGCASLFHLTLGAWVISAVLGHEVITKNLKNYKAVLFPMAFGIILTILFYLLTGVGGSSSFFEAENLEFYKYLQHWDLHQQPYRILDKGIWVAAMVLIAYFLKEESKVLKVSFASFFIIAVLHGFFGHYFAEVLPSLWWGLMPSRLLNFSIFFGCTYFFLNALKKKTLGNSLTLLHFLIVFLNILYIGKGVILSSDVLEKYKLLIFSLYVSSFSIVVLSLKLNFLNLEFDKANRSIKALLGIVFIIAFSLQLYSVPRAFSYNYSELRYYKNNTTYKKLHEDSTLLLTAPSLRQFQLVSGRPILIELDTIDDLLYNPEQIKTTSKYLEDLYGIDFFNPQKEFRNDLLLLDSWVKNNWENKSIDDWRVLKSKYQFSHIIAPKGWALKLSEFASEDRWTAYKVD